MATGATAWVPTSILHEGLLRMFTKIMNLCGGCCGESYKIKLVMT